MRNVALFVLLSRCLTAQQQSGIEGIAVDTVTHRALPGVHITMRPATVDGAMPGEVYGAVSKGDGHFSIGGMQPDSYVLGAQRNGYIYLPHASVPLKAGEPVTDFRVEMTPEAVISGRVLDEFGDPVQHVRIEVTQVSAVTDERGEFRLVVPPGKFVIRATLEGIGVLDRPEIRKDGLSPPVYGTTYYPGTENKSQARAVEVTPGHEVTGVDIRLVQKRSLTIRGVVTGMAGSPMGSFIRVLGGDGFSKMVVTAPDGKFIAAGLAPGVYRLRAQLASFRSRETEVRLDSSDQNGVTLALLAGETLSGSLEIGGGRTEELLKVTLDADGEQTRAGEVGQDGAFRLEEVFPGQFRAKVLPLPENAFVKSVKVDDVETPGDLVDLGRGVDGVKLKIVVSRNGGQIEGLVLGGDGEPLRSPIAFVTLATTAEEIGRGDFRPVAAATKFRYTGLRPGKYRLVAVDGREFAGEIEDAGGAFSKAPEIEIREGDRIEKDVKVIDAIP